MSGYAAPVSARLTAGSLCLIVAAAHRRQPKPEEPGRVRAVALVLAGRYLAQALTIGLGHGRALRWRICIETTHGLSMAALTATRPRVRWVCAGALGLAAAVMAVDVAQTATERHAATRPSRRGRSPGHPFAR